MSFEDTVTRQYAGAEGKAYHQGKRGIPAGAYPWIARLRAEKIAPSISPDADVFEYGVGAGWNLASLTCTTKAGYDICKDLAPTVEEHGIDFVHDPKQLADNSFDAVICHHVLEHVPNPVESIEEMIRLLRPGGKLLVFVPFEKERRYRRYDPAEPNRHLYSWNVQTLSNLLAKTQLKVQSASVGRFGYDRFAAVTAARLHLGEFGFRLIRGLVHLVKPALEVRVTAVKDTA
jgi:SAM-dependent methyltransferase